MRLRYEILTGAARQARFSRSASEVLGGTNWWHELRAARATNQRVMQNEPKRILAPVAA